MRRLKYTVPMNKRLYQLATVQLIVIVRVVHFEIMELQLLIRHLAGVYGDVGMLRDMPEGRTLLLP